MPQNNSNSFHRTRENITLYENICSALMHSKGTEKVTVHITKAEKNSHVYNSATQMHAFQLNAEGMKIYRHAKESVSSSLSRDEHENRPKNVKKVQWSLGNATEVFNDGNISKKVREGVFSNKTTRKTTDNLEKRDGPHFHI